jgi:hypothetical protein
MSHKPPFSAPLDKLNDLERAKRALAAPPPSTVAGKKAAAGSGSGVGVTIAAGQQSDHLLLVAAFDLWRAARQQGASHAAKVCARACACVFVRGLEGAKMRVCAGRAATHNKSHAPTPPHTHTPKSQPTT